MIFPEFFDGAFTDTGIVTFNQAEVFKVTGKFKATDAGIVTFEFPKVLQIFHTFQRPDHRTRTIQCFQVVERG